MAGGKASCRYCACGPGSPGGLLTRRGALTPPSPAWARWTLLVASLGLPWPFHGEPSCLQGRALSGGGLPASGCRAGAGPGFGVRGHGPSVPRQPGQLGPPPGVSLLRDLLSSLKKMNLGSSAGGEVLQLGAWRVQDAVEPTLPGVGARRPSTDTGATATQAGNCLMRVLQQQHRNASANSYASSLNK